MPRKAEKACGGLEVGSSLVCRVDEGTGTCPNPLISAEWPWTRFIQLLSEQVVSVLVLYSQPAHAPCWGHNCLEHKWSQGKCGQSNGLRDPEWLVSVDDAEGFGQHLLCGHPELLLCLLGGNQSTKRKLLHSPGRVRMIKREKGGVFSGPLYTGYSWFPVLGEPSSALAKSGDWDRHLLCTKLQT